MVRSLAVGVALGVALLGQWVSMSDRQPTTVLAGMWASCPTDGDTSDYTERVYEYQFHGRIEWRFEMGPRDEFALFVGPTPAAHVAHDDATNLLGPAYHYDDVVSRTGRNWSALDLHINVIRTPGSDDECYTFAVKIDRGPWRARAR